MAAATPKSIILDKTFVFSSSFTDATLGVNDAIGEGCWVDTIMVDNAHASALGFIHLRDSKTIGTLTDDLQDYVFQCNADVAQGFTLNPGKGIKFETGLSIGASLAADGAVNPTGALNIEIVGRRL